MEKICKNTTDFCQIHADDPTLLKKVLVVVVLFWSAKSSFFPHGKEFHKRKCLTQHLTNSEGSSKVVKKIAIYLAKLETL